MAAPGKSRQPYRPYARGGPWRPSMTRRKWDRPEVGWLIGLEHAVWRVTKVQDEPLTPTEREKAKGYSPQFATAYSVHLKRVGGSIPDHPNWTTGSVRVSFVNHHQGWEVYHGGRWPKCSCCGDPMPCAATIADDVVGAALDRVSDMDSRLPGTCWGCGDPIGNRQHAIRYGGDNVDHPGGIPVVFHLRADCRSRALQYELRWLAAAPDRARILTYPKCGGVLYSHNDGSDECHGSRRDPECQGHLSHDHGSQAGCSNMSGGCPRGCPAHQSWIRNKRRPKLRDPDLPQGRPEVPREPVAVPAGDARETCPGDLLVHQDGTSECIAGGRDECWGGDRFRHERERDCRSQTHGCPKCEVAG